MKTISLLLPDIRSGFNTGAFFRTCDGLGIDKIFLTGFTPYPPHREIKKTALDAENFVKWQYFLDPFKTVKKLKNQGYEIVCLETGEKSILAEEYKPQKSKVCLICGNEVDGISSQILDLADVIIKIDMKGKKESLNVSIAGSIALYELSKKLYHTKTI